MSRKTDRLWLHKALDVLLPLRYHLDQMILYADTLNTLYGSPIFHKEILQAAREAANQAERFFVRQGARDIPDEDKPAPGPSDNTQHDMHEDIGRDDAPQA